MFEKGVISEKCQYVKKVLSNFFIFLIFQTLENRSNFDLERPIIYQINGNSIRIKMHLSELRQLRQVRRYTGLKPTGPQIQYLIFRPIQPKMVKNTFLLKNQKQGCGGFHFHLPVTTFYVLIRNLAPTYPLQFFSFSDSSSLMWEA